MKKSLWAVLPLLVAGWLANVNAAPLGPVYPPPGGVSWAQVSGSSAGDAGGVVWQYTGFNDTQFGELYWGATATVTAGLDWNVNALAFAGYSGNVATWTGGSWYYNPFGGGYSYLPIQFRMTLDPLSGGAFLENPAWHGGLGAVVNNSVGDDYKVRLEFLVDYSGWRPLNSLYDGAGANSDFRGGFYYTPNVPDAGTTVGLLGFVFATLAGCRRFSKS